jgi:hypothetical protein
MSWSRKPNVSRSEGLTMIELSEEQFDAFPVYRDAMPWLKERRWFRHNDMLGILIFDEADQDWSFVALARDESGIYRGFDLGTSFGSASEAIASLEKAIGLISKAR